MQTQWQSLLKNCGAWHGQFQQFDPTGAQLSRQSSLVTLNLLEDGKTMRQTIQVGENTRILEYASLGRSVAFFENGAFSQGSTQFTPVGEFGAELGLIHGSQRLRAVVLYAKGQLTGITLIPEHLPEVAPIDPSPLQPEQIQKRWQGVTATIYPDGRSMDTHYYSRHQTAENALFLYLPHQSALAISPTIVNRRAFSLGVWWLADPRTLYRMERDYDLQGGWCSLRLSIETPRD